jgi:uncharacterized protein YjbI with pentapeptide repeats
MTAEESLGNPSHEAIARMGGAAIARWRSAHPGSVFDLSGIDLAGAMLDGALLHDTDLHSSDLTGAALNGANLRWSNLSGARLGGAELVEASLKEADLGGADLDHARLTRADLRGAGSHLEPLRLRGADLRGADLRGADLRGADLREADLRGAEIMGADLTGANLVRADLSDVQVGWGVFWASSPAEARLVTASTRLDLADLRGASLVDAVLVGASLVGVQAAGADLSRADLSGADLRDARMQAAVLRTADLSRANLGGADLALADLSDAHLVRAILMRTRLDGAQLAGAWWGGTVLWNVSFAGARGLDGCRHVAPSSLDHRLVGAVLALAQGFLAGCGLGESDRQWGTASCGIVCADSDEGFADRLAAVIRRAGAPAWVAPGKYWAGRKSLVRLDDALWSHDVAVLVSPDPSAATAPDWLADALHSETRPLFKTLSHPPDGSDENLAGLAMKVVDALKE